MWITEFPYPYNVDNCFINTPIIKRYRWNPYHVDEKLYDELENTAEELAKIFKKEELKDIKAEKKIPEYLHRLYEERDQLYDKIEKLSKFIEHSSRFKKELTEYLATVQDIDWKDQLIIMNENFDALVKTIEYLENKK